MYQTTLSCICVYVLNILIGTFNLGKIGKILITTAL